MLKSKFFGIKRKCVNISWLARVVGLNRDESMEDCHICRRCRSFFNEVYETQEEWIRRRYTEVALKKKKAGEFTYNDVKRKVQIRRDSYKRNKELIENLIAE